MRILITGINGFIGEYLAIKLLERGHKILGIGRNKKPRVKNLSAYYRGNVLDEKILQTAIRNADVVVHLAAITSNKEIVEKEIEAQKINLTGTKNILEVFLKSGAEKFIYPSTGKVYGKVHYLPINENHPTNPLNILGRSKLEVEKLIESYKDKNKQFIIFRVFNVYGPMQDKNFLIPTILKQLSKGKKEIILGDIEAKRDYVYIDDLIDAFILAIENEGQPGLSIYNICTGVGTSASKIVDLISRIKGTRIKIRINQNLIRPDEMKEEYGSYELAKKQLEWGPKINIEQGLKRLIKN